MDVEFKNYYFIVLVPHKSNFFILVCHIPFGDLLSVTVVPVFHILLFYMKYKCNHHGEDRVQIFIL